MRADVRRDDNFDAFMLFYFVAHVLACGLGYFLGNYLFEGRLSLLSLILLYVVLFVGCFFVGIGLAYVFELFKSLGLPDLSKRLNTFSFMFLSYLVLYVG